MIPESLIGRRKYIRISQEFLFDLFIGMQGKCLIKPHITLPKGCLLSNIYYDWFSQSFCFNIYHSSFDEVPDGELTPRYELDSEPWYELIPIADKNEDTYSIVSVIPHEPVHYEAK